MRGRAPGGGSPARLAALVSLLAAVGGAACAPDGDTADAATGSVTGAAGGPAARAAGPGSTVTSEPRTEPAPFVLSDASTDPVRIDGSGGEAALLAARVVPQAGFDRVVFELLGERPTVEVAYLETGPDGGRLDGGVPADGLLEGGVPAGGLLEGGLPDGFSVPAGAAVLSVRMSPVQDRFELDGAEVAAYRGSGRIEGDGTPVEEVVRVGADDDSATWLVVVDERRPFRVDALLDPNRVIIDVADR